MNWNTARNEHLGYKSVTLWLAICAVTLSATVAITQDKKLEVNAVRCAAVFGLDKKTEAIENLVKQDGNRGDAVLARACSIGLWRLAKSKLGEAAKMQGDVQYFVRDKSDKETAVNLVGERNAGVFQAR